MNLSDKYIYHFTHIENLDSILKAGLICTNIKNKLAITHHNVAASSIQERRSAMDVTCAPYGTVHDYVPFYFCSVNPMLLSLLNKKNVDQQDIIFFAISLEKVFNETVVFSDASANTVIPPHFYNDPKDLDNLDWSAINSQKWGCKDDDEKHRKMAELLVFNRVPLELIEVIIIWNERIAQQIRAIYEANNIKTPLLTYSPFKSYNFHFTKFMFGENLHSLTTGPKTLKYKYKSSVENVIEQRKNIDNSNEFLFENLADALVKIENNFCVIEELEGIFELETKNDVHKENVSVHTLNVVNGLEKIDDFKALDDEDKNILKFSAYLHDIGKGPKSRWKDGIQPVYADHPAEVPDRVQRIFIEDFKTISSYEIEKITLLATYHDLIGEIINKGRDIKQLIDIVENEKDLNMLAIINIADASAISFL